jgi:hypothetical protein
LERRVSGCSVGELSQWRGVSLIAKSSNGRRARSACELNYDQGRVLGLAAAAAVYDRRRQLLAP